MRWRTAVRTLGYAHMGFADQTKLITLWFFSSIKVRRNWATVKVEATRRSLGTCTDLALTLLLEWGTTVCLARKKLVEENVPGKILSSVIKTKTSMQRPQILSRYLRWWGILMPKWGKAFPKRYILSSYSSWMTAELRWSAISLKIWL